MRRQTLCLAAVAVLILPGCMRTVLVNELDVPGLCAQDRGQREQSPVQLVTGRSLTHARIHGVVWDAGSGLRIPGVQVRLDRAGATPAFTDSAGVFALDDVPAGSCIVEYLILGYRPRTDTLVVQDSTVTSASVPLTAMPLDGDCSGNATVPIRKLRWPWQ